MQHLLRAAVELSELKSHVLQAHASKPALISVSVARSKHSPCTTQGRRQPSPLARGVGARLWLVVFTRKNCELEHVQVRQGKRHNVLTGARV